MQGPFESYFTSLGLQTAHSRRGSQPRKGPCGTDDTVARMHSMDAPKYGPDAPGLCNAHNCDTPAEACERLFDMSLIERGLRYEQAYHAEHYKLLLITAEQKRLIAENERLKHEIEHLRQSALQRHTCRPCDWEQRI